MIGKLIRHIKEGTWAEGLSYKINGLLRPYVESARIKARARNGIHRFNILNREEAVTFLAEQADYWLKKTPGDLLVAGNSDDACFNRLKTLLTEKGHTFRHFHGSGCEMNIDFSKLKCSCILSVYFNAKENHNLISDIMKNRHLCDVPFEYVGDAFDQYASVSKHGLHHSLHFISPLLIDRVPYFDIYESSLERFEKKCDIRDYMDLCQAIAHITRHQVEGDVCEFGSFKGHSGYLISRLLEAENSGKKLYMFDMFEHFPDESVGVDAFWSQTHHVDFDEVRSKFTDRPNVSLVKGDFTKTLETVKLDSISLVYIDCDSYRGTLFLMKKLFEEKLSVNGMMIFEDYGHPALLGNRLAVHEYFDTRKDCVTFFSQFSGYYIVIKTSTTNPAK